MIDPRFKHKSLANMEDMLRYGSITPAEFVAYRDAWRFSTFRYSECMCDRNWSKEPPLCSYCVELDKRRV